jgi:hypothetical protein
MECTVCYCSQANCKLICKHSFCRDCVKQWYLNAKDTPSCPMCRKRLYFKGMHKLVKEWSQETYEKQNQDAFGEAIDYILSDESDDEEDSETDSDYDTQEDEEEPEEEPELPGPVLSLVESDTDSEEDEDEDEGSDWDGEGDMWGNDIDYRMVDLLEAERRFKILHGSGFDIDAELLLHDYYNIVANYTRECYEDFSTSNLFVSKHKGAQNGIRRCSKRVQGKRDQALGVDLVIIISV